MGADSETSWRGFARTQTRSPPSSRTGQRVCTEGEVRHGPSPMSPSSCASGTPWPMHHLASHVCLCSSLGLLSWLSEAIQLSTQSSPCASHRRNCSSSLLSLCCVSRDQAIGTPRSVPGICLQGLSRCCVWVLHNAATCVQWEWWCWVPWNNLKHKEKVMPVSLLSLAGPCLF